MNFHKLILLSLLACLGSKSLIACTCNIFGFCESIRSSSKVVEARVLNEYNSANFYYTFVDLEITNFLYGPDTLSYDTLTLSNGNSSCDVFLHQIIEPGDSLVFMFEELSINAEAHFPIFSLDICQTQHLFLSGDSIAGTFESGDWSAGLQTIAYNSFKENIDKACQMLLTSSLEPLAIELSVFPNPAYKVLSVKISQVQDIEYNIYSNTGKIIQSGKKRNQGNFTIDISDFSAGIYYLQFLIDGQTFYKKINKI